VAAASDQSSFSESTMGRNDNRIDRDALLDGSLNLFWDRGYEATSVTDLIGRLNVNSTSLYRVFGNKEELYQEALNRYRHSRYAAAARSLRKECPLTAIRDLMLEWTELAASSQGRGCFLVNAAVERVPHDQRTEAVIRAFWDQMEDELTAALDLAQAEGALAQTKDTRSIARFLLAVMQGVSVVGKLTRDRGHLQGVMEAALTVIEHGPAPPPPVNSTEMAVDTRCSRQDAAT
jgi:TetR/AcrR family transcriptional regulator, transcriptional repressor for nem operon